MSFGVPLDILQANPELGYIWEIGQNMWQRDFSSSKLYSALNREWSDGIKEIISALQGTKEYFLIK